MNAFRSFLASHPSIIAAVKGLEHAGIDGAEDLVLKLVGQKLGVLSKLFPIQSLADAAVHAAESAIDSELDSLSTDAAEFTPAPAPAAATPAAAPKAGPAPGGSPVMFAKQTQRLAEVAAVAQTGFLQVDPEPEK